MFGTNEKIEGGATIWARQTTESEVFFWKPDKWFKIWFYIVNRANHKDTRLFKRGENLFTYKEIVLKCRATENEVKHCLEYLRKANMIATHRTTRGLVIIVLKYAYFQDLKNYKDAPKSQSESQLESQLEANQKPIKSPPINNNDKNVKNDNNSNIAFEKFWLSYPNKVKKQFALKAFEKISPDGELFEKMMLALETHKQSKQWKDENGKYIPHPTTWLNQKRWEDELKVAKQDWQSN